jgi:HSP20 family molecular chaperone IbpA
LNKEKEWRGPSRSGDQDFDWRKFERLFDDLFPNAIPGMGTETASRIGRFVRGVVDLAVPDPKKPEAAVPPEARTQSSGLLRPEITETGKYVKVRIRIPDYVDARKLQLFVNGQYLKIEGPMGNKQIVRLPAMVGLKSGQASYDNGIVQIRLRKRLTPSYREMYIQYP